MIIVQFCSQIHIIKYFHFLQVGESQKHMSFLSGKLDSYLQQTGYEGLFKFFVSIFSLNFFFYFKISPTKSQIKICLKKLNVFHPTVPSQY